jgi:hypothetical protein
MTEAQTSKKGRGRPAIYTGDYSAEIAEKKRCPVCKHATEPSDYKHVRTESTTRTCGKCRGRVHKSYMKTARKPTMRERIAELTARLTATEGELALLRPAAEAAQTK